MYQLPGNAHILACTTHAKDPMPLLGCSNVAMEGDVILDLLYIIRDLRSPVHSHESIQAPSFMVAATMVHNYRIAPLQQTKNVHAF